MAQILPYNGDYYLWHYVPSLPGAIVFLLLFILATIVHSWRMFRYRVWFHVPFFIGCLCELRLQSPFPHMFLDEEESTWPEEE